MVRILFIALLFVHGLVHLIGFYSEWKLGSSSMLSGKTLFALNNHEARISGAIWLLAALTWITAGILYFLKRDSFWIPAFVAIVISQMLIIFYWHDAKFGTIANAIILVVVIISIARASFNKSVDRELSNMFEVARKAGSSGQTAKASLPQIVTKWLEVTKSTNAVPSKVWLTQDGAMRSKPSADWMSFSAVQHYTINPPGFIWNSQINAGSMITIAGRDKFENGRGNMLIKPLYMFSLANSSGQEIDQGTMLRYMGELIWFPEAAVMDYFHWEGIDSTSATLSMTYNGVSAKGTFTFDENGLVKSFSAQRFGDFDGEFRKEKWEVKVTEHNMINGHLIGSKCEVTWKLEEGDFTWLRLEVKDINYEY
jgi:hypothetical protein